METLLQCPCYFWTKPSAVASRNAPTFGEERDEQSTGLWETSGGVKHEY